MSTIGIDASRANVKERTGVEWYAYHLIQELKTVIPADHRVVLYSREPLRDGLGTLPANWESRVLSWPFKLWTQVRLSWEMKKRPPDLLFVPAHTLPVILPKHSINTIHDVGFAARPEFYSPSERRQQTAATRRAVRRASRILTVSEFSKNELLRRFGAKPEKIEVTPLGYDAERFHRIEDRGELRRVLADYGFAQPYFLCVGRLESKKNLAGLLKAFRNFKTHRGAGDPVKLVLVGKRGLGYQAAMAEIALLPVAESVIELGYIAPEHMAHIYSGAVALLFPTWYEGFGLPVLEAWACGTPVIVSKAASLPEVCGSACQFVDPSNGETITNAMDQILTEQNMSVRLAALGSQRVGNFSWKKTAERTWATIENELQS
ncbi:MAG: glycosyltransferase family 1 protein [Patescibacteria group bacterium]